MWDEMAGDTKELLFETVDKGIEFAARDAGGFLPFAFYRQRDGGRGSEIVVPAEDTAEALRWFRAKLGGASHGRTAVAIAWDGYVTVDGLRCEAVFVEAHEMGLAQGGVSVAQRYKRTGGEIQTLGNPVWCGVAAPLPIAA